MRDKPVEMIYSQNINRIGAQITSLLPLDYKCIILGVFLYQADDESYLDTHLYYVGQEIIDVNEYVDEHIEYLSNYDDVVRKIELFHDICKKENNNWTNWTLKINDDGTFTSDYSFDELAPDYSFFEEWYQNNVQQ